MWFCIYEMRIDTNPLTIVLSAFSVAHWSPMIGLPSRAYCQRILDEGNRSYFNQMTLQNLT